MDDFKPGMIVQLKSGGPEMTIVKISNLGVVCEWFYESKFQRRSFAPEILVEARKK